MASLALLVAPVAMLAPALTRWVNVFDYPVWIVGGFLFPIALLPAWTTPISYALPPYWVAEALRLSVGGAGVPQLAETWAAVAATAGGFAVAGLALAALAVRRLQTSGALFAG